MKKLVLATLQLAAASALLADTITWTGNGDGKSWNDTDNWVADSTGAAPSYIPFSAANSGDSVVISGAGVEVEYNTGDPWIEDNESLTISGGAKLTQTVASWWHGGNGSVIIDGGTFDTGSCSGTHAWSSFSLVNGGTLIARVAIPDANISFDSTSTYEMASANNYVHTGTEKFTKFTATAQGVELSATADTATFADDITWSCNLISAPSLSIVWEAGSLVLWDTAWGGYYNAGGTIDIAPGWTGSFTFAYAPANVFASCFQNKITYNGQPLSAETFEETFDVVATTITDPNGTEHAASRVSIAAATSWKIGAISATGITSSNATVSATLSETGDGVFSAYCAYGTSAITEGNILSLGTAVTETAGTYSRALTGLNENTVYNYAFAIVTNNAVAAFKAATFVASDYSYVYDNGWVGGNEPVNLPASIDSVLFLSDFTTAGEIRLDNKRIIDSTLTSGTMLYGTLAVVNSTIVNTRKNMMNQAPYGFYGDLAVPLDFISKSGNGTIRRACSYTFRAVMTQLEAFKANVIDTGKIIADGETIPSADYAARFTLDIAPETETDSFDFGDGEGAVEATLLVSTLTMWDIIPSDASGDWTLLDGARAKLSGRTRLRALAVQSADTKIDLAGQTLRVDSLVIDGVQYRGTYTAATLPGLLVGEGTLEVAKGGTFILMR